MDYYRLIEFATDVGYELAIHGAETYRVEETINRILSAYGVSSEVFAITNCLTVSIETPDGVPMTRMRRIGFHGNDLDAVEKFNGLSRKICALRPEPRVGIEWVRSVKQSVGKYPLYITLLGYFMGASGFAVFFGGTWMDFLCAGLCGILICFVNLFMNRLKANPFFSTISASFIMALAAYLLSSLQVCDRVDTVIIGALMILVPGLLFTNAMRDIIYGDTNSGINRIVQVLLIAVAIALGTAAAWNLVTSFVGQPMGVPGVDHALALECFVSFISGVGFSIVFNIHGPGMFLCALGGVLAWGVYGLTFETTGSDLAAYFWSALSASLYSETMARIRKCPAISYLVVSIFPMIPGAGVYYTMNHAVQGNMESFASQGGHTAAIAGVIAVGVLLISTAFRMFSIWKQSKKKKS